jgi:glycosyltransferase involved in cell wall biosynthesis
LGEKKKKLVFLKPIDASFVRNDIRILERYFDLVTIDVGRESGIRLLLKQVPLTFKTLYHLWHGSCLFIWFADYYTWNLILLARLFGRPTFLVLGGFETADFPGIAYGGLINPLRRFLVTRSIYNATYVLPVHKSLIERLPGNDRITGRLLEVPTGWSKEDWYRGDTPKKNQVICVATVADYQRIKIKGVDRFMEVAARLPELDFVIVGLAEEARGLLTIPTNVTPMGFVEDIRSLYAESKVYLLLSITEGLPSVLCEAMLCECVCVASDVGGSRDVVGNTGYIVEQDDLDHVAKLVENAIEKYTREMGQAARSRIVENYSPQKREETLFHLFEEEGILP